MKKNLEEAVKFNWRVPRIKKDVNISTIKCYKCGYDVEIFSDENDNKCPKCKSNISKEACKIINENNISGY